jgi:zinc D-Ala-D-Ala carboxypeptidase
MAATMTVAQAKSMLVAIGFDNARRAFDTAVRGFQAGWNLGDALAVDGDFGPKTSAALATSFARHRQGKATMSAHFSYSEFRCHCGGVFADCRRIWTLRAHVRRLEVYRDNVAAQVRIVSGCRCPGRNLKVGGSSSSQHLFGAASDIEGLVSLQKRIEMRLFAGLGFKGATGKVIHVDSRDKSGHNLTGSSPADPATWRYA